MNVLTPDERKRAYNRLFNRRVYDRNRRRTMYTGARKCHRNVRVEYPDCGYPDWMSKTEFARWKYNDWPAGTHAWIDGEQVR